MTLGTKIRFNGTHKDCGGKFSALAVVIAASGHRGWAYQVGETTYQDHDYKLLYTCGCGAKRLARSVLGKVNRDKKCGPKCLAATGALAVVACGGKNHGAGHEAHS